MATTDERVRSEALLDAQNKARDLFAEIESLDLIQPGVLESEANREIYRLSRDKYDAGRHWHKRIFEELLTLGAPAA